MIDIRVAKYIRLSREDGDDRESESIENQRDIIDNYLLNHNEFVESKEYVDDGYTGTNFKRPGFQNMLKDIINGKIDCIITKDLSRFGRDHIDTGYYLERFLPENNIRYIAIGDNVDTMKSEGLQFLTFKLSFNDYYAQDISNKIKSVKQRKIEKGEYQAGIPPYGYKKDMEKKNHLIPDKYSAEIVKEIFNMYVNKDMSTIKIADELNRKNIEPPGVYLKIPKYIKRKSVNNDGKYIWLRAQIGKILRNEVYIGNVVGRKFQKVSHKISKVRCTKKNEYIILENMHEAIIDEETWKKAQNKLDGYNIVRERKYDNVLKKVIYCGECGSKSTVRHREEKRKNGTVWKAEYFICSKRNTYSRLCDCKQISVSYIEGILKEILLKEISKVKFSTEEIVEIYMNAEKEITAQNKILELNLRNKENKLKELNKIIEEIYLDKINKIINLDDFKKLYKKRNDEKSILIGEINRLNKELSFESRNCNILEKNEIDRILNDLLNMSKINNLIVNELIEKIEYDKNKKIKIIFKFKK